MLTNLISNIQKITKDGKESYFGRRWSAETGLRKTVDRKDYTFEDLCKSSPAKQLNEQILTSFQQSPDAEKRQFVEKLTKESVAFLAKRQGMRLQQMHMTALSNEAMTAMMVRVFDRIESYSLEMNAYLGCTDLQTVATRPSHVREVMRYNKARQPLESVTYFRARIGSHSWSLVMRGKEGVIEFYLLPVGRVMGLSKSESLFEPVATLKATIAADESVEWELEDRPLTALREQELCMEMFMRLVEATREHLEQEEESLIIEPDLQQ